VKDGLARPLPLFLYFSIIGFSLFRILEIGIDPSYLFHRVDYWVRELLFFTGQFFGYVAYSVLGLSWIKVCSILLSGRQQQQAATFLKYLVLYSDIHVFIAFSVVVAEHAHAGSKTFLYVSVSAHAHTRTPRKGKWAKLARFLSFSFSFFLFLFLSLL